MAIDWNEILSTEPDPIGQAEAALEVRPLIELLAESVTLDHTLATLANAPTTTLSAMLDEATVAQAVALVHPDWCEGKQGSYADALAGIALGALDINLLSAFYD